VRGKKRASQRSNAVPAAWRLVAVPAMLKCCVVSQSLVFSVHLSSSMPALAVRRMSKSDRYDAPRVLCPVHGKDCTFDCLKCVGCRDDGVWEFQCTKCLDTLPYTADDWKKNRYAFKHARGDCVNKVADELSPAPHPPPLAVCWQPNWKPRKTKTQEPTAPSPSPATVTYHQCNPSDVVTLVRSRPSFHSSF